MKWRSTSPTNANCILTHAGIRPGQRRASPVSQPSPDSDRIRLEIFASGSCSAPRLCSGSGAPQGPRAPPRRRSGAPQPGKPPPCSQKFAESFRLIFFLSFEMTQGLIPLYYEFYTNMRYERCSNLQRVSEELIQSLMKFLIIFINFSGIGIRLPPYASVFFCMGKPLLPLCRNWIQQYPITTWNKNAVRREDVLSSHLNRRYCSRCSLGS